MILDFRISKIPVNSSTLHWGPYVFNFEQALPDPVGDPIKSVVVSSWKDDVDTTASLIDGVPVTTSPYVRLKLKYPLTTPPAEPLTGRHTLRFLVTTQSGGVNEFNFGYVEVQ